MDSSTFIDEKTNNKWQGSIPRGYHGCCRRFAHHTNSEMILRSALNVGERLRALRSERTLSIRALAELSGLNPNTISLIENGHSSPSVATLSQLAITLEVPLTAFFENEAATQPIVYYPPDTAPRHTYAQGVLEDLSAGFPSRQFEPFLFSLEPGALGLTAPIMHTGIEFVFCLQGSLDYFIQGKRFELEPGASLLFEAHLPHRWANPGSEEVHALLLLSAIESRDPALERHFEFSLPTHIEKDQHRMKIAFSASQPDLRSELNPRFGRCDCFILVDPATGAWESTPNPAVQAPDGAGVSAAQHLADQGAAAIISGHFGPKAATALQAAGIQMVTTSARPIPDLLELYISGQLGSPTH